LNSWRSVAAKFFAAHMIDLRVMTFQSMYVCTYVGDECADREIPKRLGHDIVKKTSKNNN